MGVYMWATHLVVIRVNAILVFESDWQ